MPYTITSESTADLTPEKMREMEVPFANMGFTLDEEEYLDDMRVETNQFLYQSMREDKRARSTQVNADSFKKLWEPILKAGNDILHIGFPSAMSGTYNSGRIAREQLIACYPERKIEQFDSLCGSSGQGMLVEMAVEQKREGKSLEEVCAYVDEICHNIHHWFTLDTLTALVRGGRVSGAVARVASLLNIKLILTLSREGKIVSAEKVKGRRGALKRMAGLVLEKMDAVASKFVNICHADCLNEAMEIKRVICENFPNLPVYIYMVGSAVGAHAGPGALGVFFVGRPNTRMA